MESSTFDFSHPVFGSIVASVRERLGQATFDAAWTEGRKMTLEQALAYAHA
jgi:hypothetical protein